MHDSSPSDLAVAFRSLPRRLRTAQGDLPDDAVRADLAAIDDLLGDCARLLGVPPDVEAIADAITSTPPERWEDSVLGALRAHALTLGRHLRRIEDLAAARG
jgi:hypothetical protein